MKNKYAILAILLSTSFNSNAQLEADEESRLVVTKKSQEKTTQSASSEALRTDFEIVHVKKGEEEAAIELMRRDPSIERVEIDVITKNPYFISEDQALLSQSNAYFDGPTPNDPEFSGQRYWLNENTVSRGNMALLEGSIRSKQKSRLRIGITDSGFVQDNDIEWSEGYSFTTINGEQPGPDFLEKSYKPNCSSPHGSAVAHLIGAKTDNYIGMSGAVDASLHPVRAMSCGKGYLSDLARGIRWLAKDSSLGVKPEISKPVDIINISMGASNACPQYLQSAIDYAYKKGITIIVSAGNESVDVRNYSPAGCNNVFTVAAVTEAGKQASFTNFGDRVDASGLGVAVKSYHTYFYKRWSGTSFSSPLVAGIAAQALQANPSLTPDEIFNYLRINAYPYDAEMIYDRLGSGIVNARLLLNAINKDIGEYKALLDPSLSSPERSNKNAYKHAVYIDESGDAIEPCNIFEINTEKVAIPENRTYGYRTIFSIEQGRELNFKKDHIVASSENDRFIEHNLNPDKYDYGFAFCTEDGSDCLPESKQKLDDDSISEAAWCKPPMDI